MLLRKSELTPKGDRSVSGLDKTRSSYMIFVVAVLITVF